MFPPQLFAGLFLGWALGANDAANVFGTAVASRVVSFRTAAIVCGLAVILGAFLQGENGIATYRQLVAHDLVTNVIVVCAAALTIFFMTCKKLSVSSSQAMVGGMLGVGLIQDSVDWGVLAKIVVCWLLTPICAMFLVVPIFLLLKLLFAKLNLSILTRDKIIWFGLLFFGIYGAYALGANNVANATGIFSKQFVGISDSDLALWGGIAIALGAITFGKRVMLAVGSDVMKLNGYTALISVAASSMTVHFFAYVGVPVSSNQALVGSIVGVGLLSNPYGLNLAYIKNLATGWLLTPVVALILTAAGYAFFNL